MLELIVEALKLHVRSCLLQMKDGKHKRRLFRLILIRVLIYEIGLPYKTISKLVGCATQTIQNDRVFLDDPEVVKYANNVIFIIRRKLTSI